MASLFTFDEARAELRRFREQTTRCSEEVVELWETVLRKYRHKLGDELWQVYEQVCIAALDCNHVNLADQCIAALKKKFSDSLRVEKLQGMRLEALENYEEAIKVYNAMLTRDPTNSVAWKRKIAVCKALGDLPRAASELNAYLRVCMADHEAWLELCDVYLASMDFAKAAFCMEEVLLSNPHNHLYHEKYAEILYTAGGVDNMEKARAYFAQAVKLNADNMRALFGLHLAACNVGAHPRTTKARAENQHYATWARDQIADRYRAVVNDRNNGAGTGERGAIGSGESASLGAAGSVGATSASVTASRGSVGGAGGSTASSTGALPSTTAKMGAGELNGLGAVAGGELTFLTGALENTSISP